MGISFLGAGLVILSIIRFSALISLDLAMLLAEVGSEWVVGDLLGRVLKGAGSGMGVGELVASWSRVRRGFLSKLLKGAEVR